MNTTRTDRSGKQAGSVSDDLRLGRALCQQYAWRDGYIHLARADGRTPLDGDDLELLARCAYMIGRDDDYHRILERAYVALEEAGEPARAARSAFWLGLDLLFAGDVGQGTGWLAAAQRLVERIGEDCVEKGYMLLPAAEHLLNSGEFDAALESATGAVAIAERFADTDLLAIARHLQGRIQLEAGRIDDGLALLDEAMVAITSHALSPMVTGLIYCAVIAACERVFAFARATEWTSALARWCGEQPQLVAFTGRCMLHRSEIFRFSGSWQDAADEAARALERAGPGSGGRRAGKAHYALAEIHRLRGLTDKAERAYDEASRLGYEPQPGLALLRLSQGRTKAAASAIRRTLSATSDPLERARLLPACIEIMLATGDVRSARGALPEIEALAQSLDAEILAAIAAQARGSVELAENDAEAALRSLRSAWQTFQRLDMPYLAARVRVLVGRACLFVGDTEGARLEFRAARSGFEVLGARPDCVRVTELEAAGSGGKDHGLTRRELEVLRLVADGETNRAIASRLQLSPKTVDRHVSNIFTKLDVPSRVAATRYAYEHDLL